MFVGKTLAALRTPRTVFRAPLAVWSAHSVRTVSYDGTPHSLAHSDLGHSGLARNIETVELAYDHHAPSVPTSKNPIVFLHGLFGSKSNNRAVSKQLVKLLERDVYCLDLRNHGDSPHSERHDYPAMAADVERFIVDHALEDPIVVGHSMGAKAAMALCLREPKLVSLLISVDNAPVDFTAGGTGFSKFGIYVKQLQKICRNPELHSQKDCDRVLAEVDSSAPVRQFLLTNLKRRSDNKGYYSRVPLDVLGQQLDCVSGWPFNYEVSRWNGPALFVLGSQSPYVADEYLHSTAMFFPRFEVRDIDAGHWLISEKPAEFVKEVVGWVERQED